MKRSCSTHAEHEQRGYRLRDRAESLSGCRPVSLSYHRPLSIAIAPESYPGSNGPGTLLTRARMVEAPSDSLASRAAGLVTRQFDSEEVMTCNGRKDWDTSTSCSVEGRPRSAHSLGCG